MAVGAFDAWATPIVMKKGRPGWLVTALATPDTAAALRELWWRHSSSLGLRERQQPRWVLPRRMRTLRTPLGPVPLKEALLPDGRWRGKPEHEALRALAGRHNLSMDQVRTVVQRCLGEETVPGGGSTPSERP